MKMYYKLGLMNGQEVYVSYDVKEDNEMDIFEYMSSNISVTGFVEFINENGNCSCGKVNNYFECPTINLRMDSIVSIVELYK